MKHLHTLILSALLCLALAGCDSDPRFTVSGKIDGVGAQTLSLTYFADGGLRRVTTPATDGSFTLTAVSATPSLATLSLSDGTLIATLVVENGMEINLQATLSDPTAITVEGSKPSEKIARWLNDNADAVKASDTEEINASIARFVTDNSSDPAATALLTAYFRTKGHERQADSLFTAIDPSARTAALVQNFSSVLASQLATSVMADIDAMALYERSDSLFTYNPRSHTASMLCFLPTQKNVRDTITPHLRALVDSLDDKTFRAVEINTATDSTLWRASISNDSATWLQTWAPGSVAGAQIRRLAVPSTPYFIVVDRNGTQKYRGSSITEAERTVHSTLK